MRTFIHITSGARLLLLLFLLMSVQSLADTADPFHSANTSESVQSPEILPPSSSPDAPIRIGVLANRGSAIAMQEWGPTAEYLSNRLAPLRFVIVPLDFNQTYDAVKNQEVSFICANPSVYTYFEYYGLAQRIATLQVPGYPDPQAVYGAVIITRSDRDDITDLTDLKGKSFAAVDPTSLGGWQAAWSELLKSGVDPDHDLSSLIFTKTQDASVQAVVHGTVDAATARSTQLERMAAEGQVNLSSIKVLGSKQAAYPQYPYLLSTPLYPEWPFATLTGTDQNLSKRVSVSLLMMETDDPAAKAVRGAGWAVPQDHTSVHELLRHLHLPPYEHYGKITVEQILNQYWHTILSVILALILLTFLLIKTLQAKKELNLALLQVRESEQAVRLSKADLEVTHDRLRESQKRLLDSIHYARLIQGSILPSKDELDEHLADPVTILEPLDIVGGDFYLLKKTNDGFIIAVADCTGHGVPGACMTMMASTLLTRVIETSPDATPASILVSLHELVQHALRAQSDTEHLENGLDLALCRVYPEQGELLFAGAGLPLIIMDEAGIREIPGSRMHLGFSLRADQKTLEDHRILIRPGSRFFLITDGILDLPGGRSGYGLGRLELLSLLERISLLPGPVQKEKILEEFARYQGDWQRRDDMTLIGFSIKVE